VGQKQNADNIAAMLVARGFQVSMFVRLFHDLFLSFLFFKAASTHGEKGQQERHKIHFAFKNG
jgi:superfamily II DNA/RNA helicase